MVVAEWVQKYYEWKSSMLYIWIVEYRPWADKKDQEFKRGPRVIDKEANISANDWADWWDVAVIKEEEDVFFLRWHVYTVIVCFIFIFLGNFSIFFWLLLFNTWMMYIAEDDAHSSNLYNIAEEEEDEDNHTMREFALMDELEDRYNAFVAAEVAGKKPKLKWFWKKETKEQKLQYLMSKTPLKKKVDPKTLVVGEVYPYLNIKGEVDNDYLKTKNHFESFRTKPLLFPDYEDFEEYPYSTHIFYSKLCLLTGGDRYLNKDLVGLLEYYDTYTHLLYLDKTFERFNVELVENFLELNQLNFVSEKLNTYKKKVNLTVTDKNFILNYPYKQLIWHDTDSLIQSYNVTVQMSSNLLNKKKYIPRFFNNYSQYNSWFEKNELIKKKI